jgi:hypothetical protein
MIMKEEQHNANDQVEIGFLFKKVGDIFKSLVRLLFSVLTFTRKYLILIIVLAVVGLILGYFLDQRSNKIPVYQNHVIVIPNFESVDYLYETVEGLNSKIVNNDTIYLKSILGDNYKFLTGVDVEPIVDIYNFATKSEQNIDVFRILFQNQELSEFVEDMTTSKYFKYHRLNFAILGNEHTESIVASLLENFDDNAHFKLYQELMVKNNALMIAESQNMIKQIDSLIQATILFSKNKQGNQSVFINDNSDLATLVYRKQDILEKNRDLLIKLNDETAVIKTVGANYNIIKKSFFSFSNKVKLPVAFVLLFYGFFFVRYVYKLLKEIAEES